MIRRRFLQLFASLLAFLGIEARTIIRRVELEDQIVSYAEKMRALHPIAYWPLGEGNAIRDASGNGHDGKYVAKLSEVFEGEGTMMAWTGYIGHLVVWDAPPFSC